MTLPFAGGAAATLFSIISGHLLPFFDTPSACALRLVCKETLASVTAFPWADRCTVIRSRLSCWRACFPRARAACVRGTLISDPEFQHFSSLLWLDMAFCPSVTSAAFQHLPCLLSLDMSYCSQEALGDAAFPHLASLRELNLSGCTQASLTDAALAPLAGTLRALRLDRCTQFSDALFSRPLPRLRTLSLQWCTQFTDAAFPPLRALAALDISHCRQPSLTDAALQPLQALRELRMVGCYQHTLTGSAFARLPRLAHLDMRMCRYAAREGAARAGNLVHTAAPRHSPL